MARGPPRSQRGPTQTQHAYEDDDDEEGYDDEQEDVAEAVESQIIHGSLERKARDLVRLLLFNEQRRVQTRRDEISKKVLGSGSRNFNAVLNEAQNMVRKTFGMEIVELTSRGGAATADLEPTQAKEMEGMGLKKKVASGPKSYILRSTLPPHIIAQASTLSSFPDILALEQAEMNPSSNIRTNIQYDYAEEEGSTDKGGGAIFAWGKADQMGVLGVLYVVLAIVLVSGRVISEADLNSHLKRLHLSPMSLISLTPSLFPSIFPSSTPTALLSQFIKQGYLERTAIGTTGAKGSGGAGKKRGRALALAQPSSTQGGSGGAQHEEYEWRWGPRAHAEIGEKAVGQFISDFVVDMSLGEEGEDNEEARERMRGGVVRGVERAAGAGSAGGGGLEEETKVD